MKKNSKIYIVFVIISLVSFVGGFCASYAYPAQAASSAANEIMDEMHAKLADPIVVPLLQKEGKKNSLMPCCSTERAGFSLGMISFPVNGKINLQSFLIPDIAIPLAFNDVRKTDNIFLTSPPGGGLVSNVIKIE